MDKTAITITMDSAATEHAVPQPEMKVIDPIAPGDAWTDYLDYLVRDEFQVARDNSMESCAVILARAAALGTTYTFTDWLPRGMHWKVDIKHTQIADILTALGGRLQAEYRDNGHFFVWVWPDGMVRYQVNTADDGRAGTLYGSQWVCTCNPELHEVLLAAIKGMYHAPARPRPLYGSTLHMLIGTPMSGYGLKQIGHTGERLVPENYTPNVRAAFDKIQHALTAPNPDGRITLIEGPPGTGKTRAVTAILAALCNTARIVIVPSHMVAELSGPDLIGSLIGWAAPTVLVLEDADQAMLSREVASEKDKELNTGALASLLNLSDGLVGSLCNFRIVATTNAKVQDIDPALLRPGRLLCRVHITSLDRETAAKVIDRETQLGEAARVDYLDRFSCTDNEARIWWTNGTGPTLAEAYEIARRIVAKHEAAQETVKAPEPVAKPKRSHKKKKTTDPVLTDTVDAVS